uniref:FYVE zinc finger domain-containing protein n=1 Tax=Timema genevievae TaxID=629358 RepID=A0A7R9PKE6_TIMGE|nr:unnamed protein product [Timema genevievae]
MDEKNKHGGIRHCGRILCSKCSDRDVPILKFNLNKPVRVCFVCFDVLQESTGIFGGWGGAAPPPTPPLAKSNSVLRRKYTLNIPLLCETQWSHQKYKSIIRIKAKMEKNVTAAMVNILRAGYRLEDMSGIEIVVERLTYYIEEDKKGYCELCKGLVHWLGNHNLRMWEPRQSIGKNSMSKVTTVTKTVRMVTTQPAYSLVRENGSDTTQLTHSTVL